MVLSTTKTKREDKIKNINIAFSLDEYLIIRKFAKQNLRTSGMFCKNLILENINQLEKRENEVNKNGN